jgi:hypothetical protein
VIHYGDAANRGRCAVGTYGFAEIIGKHDLMSTNSNDVIQKKRGRPAIGQDPVLSFRIPPHFRDTIDDWRSKERDQPSRSVAIRWLIGKGLKAEALKSNK